MGTKNDRLTNASSVSAEDLQESLLPLGDVRIRKMFGGYGVFEGETMFALVDSNGVIFFKADDTNRQMYEEAGSQKHGRMPYFQVPNEVLADEQTLKDWAHTSIDVSKKGKRKKK